MLEFVFTEGARISPASQEFRKVRAISLSGKQISESPYYIGAQERGHFPHNQGKKVFCFHSESFSRLSLFQGELR